MKTFPGLLLALVCCSYVLQAQPYVDVVTLRGAVSPDAGVWRRNNIPVRYWQYIAGTSVPIVFKKDSSKLILSAYTEHWEIKTSGIKDNPHAFQSVLGAVTYIKPISKKWSLSGSIIPRWNGNANDVFDKSFQLGASLVGWYKVSPDLSFRAGVYYNSEFFGPFIIPLAGIDWKISKKDNLFGLAPQILTYEHRISDRFSWGAVYRMFNNSYRIGYRDLSAELNYMRIVETQLMLSADVYLTKRIVFNVEAGHSLFRKLRLGTDANGRDYYSDEKVNDGFIVKAALLYKVRTR